MMKTKPVYNYHPDSGEYLGTSYADESPLEPDNWLIPAYATIIEPPQSQRDHSCPIFSGKEWVIVDDYRGIHYWLADGEEWQTDTLGVNPPQGALTEKPEPPAPTPTQLTASAIQTRDELLRTAAIRIAPLQDAIDIGEATAAEEQQLLAWKKYRVALNRITEQPGFPTVIEWPETPA